MATRTRDIAPLVKGKRSTNTSKTKSLVHTHNATNPTASNKNIIPSYLKSKPASSSYSNIHHKQTPNHKTSIDKPPSSLDNVHGKNAASTSDANIHNKDTLARRSLDYKAALTSSLDNTQGKKLVASSSSVPPNIHNTQTLARRRLSLDHRPSLSSSLDNTRGKKLVSSSSDPNIHSKQSPARRRLSFDHRPPPHSVLDNSPQGKKLTPSSSDPNIHNKQTLARRRSFDHKPPLSSPLLKNRTISPNPRERIIKPSLSLSSKTFTSQKPLMNKLSKSHYTSTKDVIGNKHAPGLYARAVKQDSPAGLTSKTFITSNLPDIVEHIDPRGEELLEQEEHQEQVNESDLVIEDHEELNDNINIEEYLKAAESSLYVVENQEVIKMEVQEEKQLVEETRINNHKEVEEIKNEPSKLDVEEIEKQESVIKTVNENQEKNEEVQESEVLLKELDNCQQEKEEEKENKEKELEVHIKEEKAENEGRNKGKEENKVTTMGFAKPYLHLVQGNKKESVVSNDVIEETANKLREQRKNRVKALASAFETVISLQDSR
ncbi:PREDICTED: intracellular protein transport protein USO1-like [Nicotiana attenuata]|uniref:Calmodulin-binding domain-containing protein n=1 Tax=Nicotiana attenuata TaxID=49451 RepID=A0A314L8L6_NICAT|nr:PREDICTED: intracellular protein transport protein USO1-like [Nicotiana attenuata]OIT38131.1 hypothetical protein A4A49_30424 [Nicotiana attenuata]